VRRPLDVDGLERFKLMRHAACGMRHAACGRIAWAGSGVNSLFLRLPQAASRIPAARSAFYLPSAKRNAPNSAPRMVLSVEFLHTLARDVRIDLRRGQVAVSEQHLNDAQVGTVIEQVRCEGMPQSVGG
jgi:hypothetical protein